MARALLHTLVRSCAKTPGHGLMVREGIHYTMLPACTDEKRQGVTCGASQPAQWQYEQTDSTGRLLRSTYSQTRTHTHRGHFVCKNICTVVENVFYTQPFSLQILQTNDCSLYLQLLTILTPSHQALMFCHDPSLPPQAHKVTFGFRPRAQKGSMQSFELYQIMYRRCVCQQRAPKGLLWIREGFALQKVPCVSGYDRRSVTRCRYVTDLRLNVL